MKSKTKLLIFCTCVFLLVVVWIWRYTSLNDYYQTISNQRTVYYALGEKVPFSSDYIDKDLCANGYWIQVNKFEILSYEDYASTLSTPLKMYGATPEKIALVYITLYNENSTADGVMLTELTLHGIDSYAGMNWDALLASNSILEGSFGVQLASGSYCNLVLPFNLFSSSFSSHTWEHINEYDFFLRITAFPTAKDLQTQ